MPRPNSASGAPSGLTMQMSTVAFASYARCAVSSASSYSGSGQNACAGATKAILCV